MSKMMIVLLLWPPLTQAAITVEKWSDGNLAEMSQVAESMNQRKQRGLNVILWYFGPNGFMEEGAQFYKENLFEKTASVDVRFFLYDLTAWRDFALKTSSIAQKQNETQNDNRFSILFSSTFFDKFRNYPLEQLDFILKTVGVRPYLWEKSYSVNPGRIRKPSQSRLRETQIFQPGNPLTSFAQAFYELPSNYTYSFFQYLEGIFLVQEILERARPQDEIEILFLLPNDELDYYTGSSRSFRDFNCDLNQFIPQRLQRRFGKIAIYFQNFKYGDRVDSRPYLNGTVFKKSKDFNLREWI